MKRFSNKQGFTLVEVIVVLVLLGIVAIAFGNIIISSMQGYIFARNTDQLSQKSQLAMARIKIELTDVTAVAYDNTTKATKITYTVPKSLAPPSCSNDTGCQYTLFLSGTQITLQDVTNSGTAQVLIDGLTANNNGNNFLSYWKSDGTEWATTDGISALNNIQVILSLANETGSGVVPVKYEGWINPRGNTVINAPCPN